MRYLKRYINYSVGLLLCIFISNAQAKTSATLMEKEADSDGNLAVSLLFISDQHTLKSGYVSLSFVCAKNGQAVTLILGEPGELMRYITVQYRVDDKAPVTESWEWGNNTATKFSAEKLIRELLNSKRFAAMLIPGMRSMGESAAFDLTVDRSKSVEFAEKCENISR